MELLAGKGAEVAYHDPFVPYLELNGKTLASQPLAPEVVSAQDCVVILTAHTEIDYRRVVRDARLVFDARGATVGMSEPHVIRL